MSGNSMFQDPEIRAVAVFAASKWKKALQITAVFVLMGALFQILVTPYSLKSTILINDAQTSQLQAFTNNFFSLSKMQASARKGKSPSQTAIDFLERQDTYTAFLKYLVSRAQSTDTNLDTRVGLSAVESFLGVDLKKPNFNIRQTANDLRSLISLSSKSPTEVQVTAQAPSREFTYFINTEYSKFAIEALKQQEQKEMEKVSLAIQKQRDHFKSEFEAKNKELIQFQSLPENVLSLASGASVSDYISELLVRKNEIELKITENERTIQYLGGKKAASLAKERNLGQRSQAQQLIEETGLLRKQANAIQESVKKFTSATNGTAEAMRMHEELKQTAEREFKNFQEANDLLSKMGVYSVSIDGKFELLHAPEEEEVRKAMSLYLVLALSIFLSQMVFAGYIYALWSLPSQDNVSRPLGLVKVAAAAAGSRYAKEMLSPAE